MRRYFLTRLQIEGFRGINNSGSPLDLRFRSNAVNSIWAPNGLGKSSIFEALCYAIRGEVPKLKRLEAGERPEDYYCNRFHGGDATIGLTFSPDDGDSDVIIEVVRSRTGTRSVTSPSGHPSPEAFLQSLNEDHTLLDYTTFASFMENSALDRGRSFSSLLGMAHLSQVRQALEQLSNRGNTARDFNMQILEASRDQLDAEHQQAVRSLRSNYQALTGQPIPDPINIVTVIDRATAALSGVALLTSEFKGHTLMDVFFETLAERVKSAEGGENRERLANVVRQIAELQALAPAAAEPGERGRLSALMTERDRALEGTRGEMFERLYRAVQTVLASGHWETPERCPACESTPSRLPAEHVAEHLAAFSAAADKNDEAATAWAGAGCVRRFRALEAAPALALPDDQRRHAIWESAFRQRTATREHLAAFTERLDSLEASRQTTLQALEAEKESLEKVLPRSLVTLIEQLETAKQLKDNIRTYQCGVDGRGQRARIKRQILQRERWVAFVDLATTEFAAAETAFSRSQTTALEKHYQGMFAAITQRVEIVPTLEKPSGTERLDLRLERFFDLENLSARPLLSESYRNAFGISVFLSAALDKRSAPRFIVLDDITSSFDAGHQWFLMELLRTRVGLPGNDSGVQLIILSHDGLLEKYFDKLSNQQAWHHHRLQGQSPTGAVLSEAQQSNRLRADADRFLVAGQVRQAEPLIRQYLEFKLMQIITSVRIPVPIDFVIRDDRRMVQNCLDSITAAVGLHKRAGDLVLDNGQVSALQNTHVPCIAGNWVSHYETGSIASLAPSVLQGVLRTIDELAECFRYLDTASGNHRYFKALSQRQ